MIFFSHVSCSLSLVKIETEGQIQPLNLTIYKTEIKILATPGLIA